MPKLLQINSTANWGSTGRIAEQIGVMAMADGWESYIAYGRNAAPSRSKLIRVGTPLGQLWHLVLSQLFDLHGRGSLIATKRLVRQIEQLRPDVVHLHNLHGYYLNYKVLFDYLNRRDIPVVWTLHDCWAMTGHCAHFSEVGCDRWQTECGSCRGLAQYPISRVGDSSQRNFRLKASLYAANHNLHIVAVSEWLKKLVEKSILRDAECRVINNGVNLSRFCASEGESTPPYRVIGVANRWTDSKGLADFCELHRRLDASRFEIVLVGLSDEQLRQLPEGMVGIGRTDTAEQLAELYSQATVFVNATYADTFPTTNLEAMASGTPVVTYRTGGSPEAVSADTGIVVEQGDVEALCKAVEQIALKGRSHYSKACRKRAEKLFDKQKNFRRYIELYDEIINRNSK